MRTLGRKRKSGRTVSRTERIVGCLLLLALPAIGGGIYYSGQRYDPALFAFDPASEKAKGREGAVLPVAPPSAAWIATGGVERFGADSLFVKIDGRADQYLAYDVVGLEAMTFSDARRPDRLLDVYVYDMGQPANAFGVFSAERSPGTSLTLGREGYRSQSSVFFYKGRYYAQVLPSEAGEEMARTAVVVAEALAGRMRDDGQPLWGITAFPTEELVPHSVQYMKHDALSLDFLREVYTARYAGEGGEVLAFLCRQEPGVGNEEIFDKYLAYLQRYGRVLSKAEVPGGREAEAEIGGSYEAIFRMGGVFGGVTGAKDLETAVRRRGQIVARASGGSPLPARERS